MLKRKAPIEKVLTFVPCEYKRYFKSLSVTEINLIESVLLEEENFLEIGYMTFCKKTLEVALNNLGKYQALEKLAADIAYDIRRLDILERIAQKSENPFVFFPLIKGMISRNSLSRAVANTRIVESNVQVDDIANQLELFIVKAMYASAYGNLTDALFLVIAAKEYLSSAQNELDIAEVNSFMMQILAEESTILLNMGRYDKAFEIINEGLVLSKKVNNRLYTLLFELFYGNYLIEFNSNIEEGIQHHWKAAAQARKLMNPHLIALTLQTIAKHLKIQNKIDEGLKFCKHAEKLVMKTGDEQARMIIADTIADLHIAFGHYSKGIKILLELEVLGSRNPLTYLNLVNSFINTDDLDLAEAYIDKTKKMLRGRGNLPREFQLIYYEGILELKSGNFGKAEMLLANAQEFAEMNKLSYLAFRAYLQLINVLVLKNIVSPSQRNYRKAKFAIVEMSSNIRKDDSSLQYNELELFKAILLFSNKNLSEAKAIFQEVIANFQILNKPDKVEIAQEYLERIRRIEVLNKQMSITHSTKETNAFQESFIAEEINSWNILSSRVDPTTPYIEIDANPMVLLILSESGLPLHSHYFSDSYSELDETLMSGFLGAIVSFTEKINEGRNPNQMKDVTPGFLQGIRHGNFEILLERCQGFILALVADHENYLLRRKLKRLGDELNILLLLDDEPVIVLGERNVYLIQSIINKIFC